MAVGQSEEGGAGRRVKVRKLTRGTVRERPDVPVTARSTRNDQVKLRMADIQYLKVL